MAVQSAAGKGSTFTVTLPRELPGGELDMVPAPLPAVAGARSVLIVDDDESTRKLLWLELEPHGFTVLEAADGQTAIEIARARQPSVIVLDVLMPRLDGWTVLRALKESPETRSIPVVIHSVVDNRPFAFSLGAFDYLVKPVTPGRLFEVLSRAGVVGFPGYVLIVDDDADIRELFERELQAAGFRTVSVLGGAEALAQMAEETPSSVLLDLLMPDPDGFEVIYRMRENPALRAVPVVVMTAKDLTAEDYDRLNGAAQRILGKGADMTRLVSDVLRSIGQERGAALNA